MLQGVYELAVVHIGIHSFAAILQNLPQSVFVSSNEHLAFLTRVYLCLCALTRRLCCRGSTDT